MPTATKKSVSFISTDQNLRLVDVPIRRRVTDAGVEQIPGSTIEFRNGVYDTNDPDEIKFLREHGLHDALGQPGSFVEKGKEPGRALPEEADLLEQIVDATVDGDAEKVAEIYLAERTTHSRDAVLKAAARSLEKLKADVPAPPDTPEHELVRTRPASARGAEPGEDAPEGREAEDADTSQDKGKGK